MLKMLCCILSFFSLQYKAVCHKYTFEEAYNARSQWCNYDIGMTNKALDYQYCMSVIKGFEPK